MNQRQSIFQTHLNLLIFLLVFVNMGRNRSGPKRVPKNLYNYQRKADLRRDRYGTIYPQSKEAKNDIQFIDANGVKYRVPSNKVLENFKNYPKTVRLFPKQEITQVDVYSSLGKKILEIKLPKGSNMHTGNFIKKRISAIHVKTNLECTFKIERILSGPKAKSAIVEVSNFKILGILSDTTPYYKVTD